MIEQPLSLVAELTYGCPLHCPYCSNPLNMQREREELTLVEWKRVLHEAQALGILQVALTGGEPLQRHDLEAMIVEARTVGLYSNLITSALGLTESRARALQTAGLDHVQISMQAADAGRSDFIAGTPSFERKIAAAHLVKRLGFPLTLNVVLHRHNIEQVDAILQLAEEIGADRIELANTQYYGWALHNRDALLPSWEQLQRAEPVVHAARVRLGHRMQILYVIPDYYSQYPKPCMSGWARQHVIVTPYGDALPCQAAGQLPAMIVPNVRHESLGSIWESSPMFNRFRGTDWMPEPCRSCDRQLVDYGGCRCQAFQLTGDATATDPVCHLAPQHAIVITAVRAANEVPAGPDTFVHRTPKTYESRTDQPTVAQVIDLDTVE
ncbi:MAG: pyrroloquinoline quinone biosynthesis protein PqqE [Herpetosiphon sp.]